MASTLIVYFDLEARTAELRNQGSIADVAIVFWICLSDFETSLQSDAWICKSEGTILSMYLFNEQRRVR